MCVSAAVGIKHEQTFQLSYPSIDFFSGANYIYT